VVSLDLLTYDHDALLEDEGLLATSTLLPLPSDHDPAIPPETPLIEAIGLQRPFAYPVAVSLSHRDPALLFWM
jgi:hypothetical protein